MSLLNYTTGIDAAKTVGQIQEILAKHGAQQVMADYDDQGNVTAVSFRIKIDTGNVVAFRLPSDWRPVLEILKKDRKVPRNKETKEQAMRVSWRIIKDWVEAQMAIIETRMVKAQQVFLPYAVGKDNLTLYEKFEKGGLNNLLPAATDRPEVEVIDRHS